MDTETESTERPSAPPTSKPAKKRKVAKKRTASRPPAEPKPKPAEGMYAGLTVQDCCTACNADGCVISGKSYCAHPRKGGLHAAEQQNEAALRRRRDAERVLGKLKLIVE